MKQWVSQNKILSFIWFGGILWFVCVYWPGWHNPFFQDDFLLLDLAHPDKIRSIKDLFQPISLNFHYRPLAFNVYYYLLQTFFGLNWHAFHILNAIQLIGVSWLVYLIFKHVLESAFWASVGAVVYLIAPIHFMTQFWTATFNNTQGTGLLLASFYLFLLAQEQKKGVSFQLCSIGMFILGLLTNESVIILPGIIFMYLVLVAQKPIIQALKKCLYWLFPAVSYVLIRAYALGFPRDSDYGLEFSLAMIKTIRWYVLRALGLPEGIAFVPYQTVLYLMVIGLVLLLGRIWVTYARKVDYRMMAFGASWFLGGGLLFFAMPHHLSGYYLEIAMVGVVLIWLELLSQTPVKISGGVFLLVWSIISFFSIQAMKQTHWVSWRGEASRQHISAIKELCPQIRQNQLTYEVDTDISEVSVVLSKDKAARVICQDFDLDFRIVEKTSVN